MATSLVLFGLTLGVLAPGAAASAPPGQSPEPDVTNTINLYLRSDGTVQAREDILFTESVPDTFQRDFVTGEHYDSDHDRVYEISKLQAVDSEGDRLDFELTEQDQLATATIDLDQAKDVSDETEPVSVTLTYEVTGTTTDMGDTTEFSWYAVGGYTMPVAETLVTVDAEVQPLAVSCAAGDPRSSIYCTSSDMGGTDASMARFTQANLSPGETLRVAVNYPPGSAAEQLELKRNFSFASAFQVTPFSFGVFAVITATLIGGLVALIWARGRDERALRRELAKGTSTFPGLSSGSGRFRPPEDVHPGQIGTLIDEQADIVDITATVIDLAVRGYLDITEEAHGRFAAADWTLRRYPPPADADPLRRYEQILLDALFDDRTHVRLSELGDDLATVLPEIRQEMYKDMVRLRWFARRPNVVRNRWTTTGVAVTVGGVLVTALLAALTNQAFIGLALIITGSAVTVGAQYMPAKTARGSTVLAHTLAFRSALGQADAHTQSVPTDDRVDLFSRYLPYAIIFGQVEKWAGILAAAGEELDYNDLPWYHAPAEWRLEDFTDSIMTLTRTMSGVISNTRPSVRTTAGVR
ncbi:DUF2207 domain-containing protein [Spiractinospora alimapuensis]|uniref:DUF2207 domain-containing protein n=1 Tax=Spiractinospora alimapuensis TaxID=2820884 RepID=UPI001F39F621|nr:DUF2207 domain-containing protein [Spiractinospora alimapuensis]QVQ50788.1 DUF2207 domain-containing protein [Spiractinospora alimapuensis]